MLDFGDVLGRMRELQANPLAMPARWKAPTLNDRRAAYRHALDHA
jgi:hypothetical protein